MSEISKLGMGIVAFEGTEHIKNIASEVRSCVREIVVCLQEVSYTGVRIDQYDIDEVYRCLDAGLIDRVVWYSYTVEDIADAKKAAGDNDWPRYLELEKRNKLLDVLEADGCTHAIISDSDEYYDGTEFKNAVAYFDSQEDVHVTYCQYVNYWKDYRHYIAWTYDVFVPFIADIKYRFEFDIPLAGQAVDKTRRYGMKEGENYSVISWESLKMHHLSWIRLDVEKKVRSWSAIKYFTEEDIQTVVGKYNTWTQGDNAYVTFHSPLRPMCVVDMGRQYIFPKYMLSETING